MVVVVAMMGKEWNVVGRRGRVVKGCNDGGGGGGGGSGGVGSSGFGGGGSGSGVSG